MKASFLSRKWHKWLFLIIGVQMCLWAISGFYMVVMSIDYIHGDHLVKEEPPQRQKLSSYTYALDKLVAEYPTAVKIETSRLFDTPVYQVQTPQEIFLIDAQKGNRLPPLTKESLRPFAEKIYGGSGPLSSLELLTENPPSEIQGRRLPLWRADFDDPWSPSLYLSPITGEVITKRHDFWRTFDFLWMFHIMDYQDRSDVNNWLLRLSASLVALSTLTGIWLLFYSFRQAKANNTVPVSPKGRFFRVTHKWLGLIIGLQVTIWAISGLTMSILPHDMVQGHDMAHHKSPKTLSSDRPFMNISDLSPPEGIGKLSLYMFNDQPIYEITQEDNRQLINARTGSRLQITEHISRNIASQDYSGPGTIINATQVQMPTSDTPRQTGAAWKLDFDDSRDTSLFISADTGQVMARVNNAQRLFNFALMLHFMDYPGNNHFNSPWIITVAFFTLWLALSGIILIFQSFTKEEFTAVWRKLNRSNARHQLTILDSFGGLDNEVKVSYGETIYNSLSQSGIDLPSSCGGGGSCGLCRVKLHSATSPVHDAERHHFTQQELDEGYRLSCQQRISHDTTLELPENILAQKPFTAEVISSKQLTPTIHEIRLKIPTSETFTYQAGSYMLVNIPGKDGIPLNRAYSLATALQDNPQEIVFNIRRIVSPADQPQLPAGVGSHYMCDLKAGDKVTLSGPFGHFSAQDSDREMVLIGGGAGMAPLRAIIRDQLLHKNSRRKISFWYGVRNTQDIFYDEEFNHLSQKYDNMNFQIGLSDPTDADDWQGPIGYIHEITMKQYLAQHPDLSQVEFYLCGPPAMLKATREMLYDLGIQETRIAFDDFGI